MKRPILLLFCAILLAACAPAAEPSPTPAPTQTASSTPAPSATPTETPTPTVTDVPISAICSPLKDHSFEELAGYITQPLIPPLGSNKELGHHGVDFAYYQRDEVGGHVDGTPLQSVLDGVVAGGGYTTVYGNYLIIETAYIHLPAPVIENYGLEAGQSLYLAYAHMRDEPLLSAGDAVTCGDLIGNVGGSGDPYYVTDPHLHLETRAGPAGVVFAHMDYYNTQASEDDKAEWEYWRSSDSFTLLDPLLLLGIEP